MAVDSTKQKESHDMAATSETVGYDAVVIGAGFAGLYSLYRLRNVLGLSVRVYEAGGGVGGTWYWNRYPGARCDTESYMYCYSFDKELLQEWNWSGKYPEQPEILRYLDHVADRFDLRKDIQFNARVTSAKFVETENQWEVETDTGERVRAQFVIAALGILSAPNVPNIKGLDSFEGEWHFTGAWPHEGVDLNGKRVGVIGTGSSGVQSIPVIAAQAKHLYVFQRTANYSIPARHETVDQNFLEEVKAHYDELWEKARWSPAGVAHLAADPPQNQLALEVNDEQRRAFFEAGWMQGGFKFAYAYPDTYTDRRANDTISEFIRMKIREVVKDPETAEKLVPVDHPFGSKRPLIDSDYFETYNRDNVTLVDIRHSPIEEITRKGIRTADGDYELDIIVFATGFDAITGAFDRIDIRGRNGFSLKEKWAEGPATYLGLANAGFPNLFMIVGPGSTSVLVNLPVAIEQAVDWISDVIEHMRDRGMSAIEAEPEAEAKWGAHVKELVDETLYMLADSWFVGANIPGKPRVFPVYVGGGAAYRTKCNEVSAEGYRGFTLSGPRTSDSTRQTTAGSTRT